MQTRLTEEMRQNARALEADSILRACVHWKPTASCAPVFTADFVPQPAQPISFWAMNWTGRAGASI